MVFWRLRKQDLNAGVEVRLPQFILRGWLSMGEVPQLVLDEGCCSSSRRGWALVKIWGSSVNGMRNPSGQVLLEWLSEKHCWSSLLQDCHCCWFAPLGTGGLEGCSLSVWGARQMRRRWRWQMVSQVARCYSRTGPGHIHDGASPSPYAGRKNHSSVLCCIRCMSHQPCDHSSSSSVGGR